MNNAATVKEKWNEVMGKIRPVSDAIWNVVYPVGMWIYRLRSLILAIPVVILAIWIARINFEMLPDLVGINLQNNGEYAYMVAKEVAVYGPMAITALCLLMVVMSKKTLYPWLISLFSLVLPFLILLTNVFPA